MIRESLGDAVAAHRDDEFGVRHPNRVINVWFAHFGKLIEIPKGFGVVRIEGCNECRPAGFAFD